MALAIAGDRHPKFPTHQPITKSMYFLPRESVTMLPLVAATCSSAGHSLARTCGFGRRGMICILPTRNEWRLGDRESALRQTRPPRRPDATCLPTSVNDEPPEPTSSVSYT